MIAGGASARAAVCRHSQMVNLRGQLLPPVAACTVILVLPPVAACTVILVLPPVAACTVILVFNSIVL